MTDVRWTVPNDLLESSLAIMKPSGAQGNEGLALWFGTCNQRHVQVTHAVEVSGPGFRSRPLYLSLSLATMSSLTSLAAELGVYLVGQIHSHPGQLLDLSELDEVRGIRAPDYLSAVCPHYAQQPQVDWMDCGIHVYEGDGYRRLSDGEIERRITVWSESVVLVRCRAPA
jgi:hypothetical protein